MTKIRRKSIADIDHCMSAPGERDCSPPFHSRCGPEMCFNQPFWNIYSASCFPSLNTVFQDFQPCCRIPKFPGYEYAVARFRACPGQNARFLNFSENGYANREA